MTDGATCQVCGELLPAPARPGGVSRRYCSNTCQQVGAAMQTRPARLRRRAAHLETQAVMHERRAMELRAQVAELRKLADAEP